MHSSVGKESACNAGDLGLIHWLEDPLEKEKVIHSSILAWRIPWIVQSMGSQRVRHDWVTCTFTFPLPLNLNLGGRKYYLKIALQVHQKWNQEKKTQSKREHLTLLSNLELPWVTHEALTLSWKDFGRKERKIVGLLVLLSISVSLTFIHNLVFTLLGHLPHFTTEEEDRAQQTYLRHNNCVPASPYTEIWTTG